MNTSVRGFQWWRRGESIIIILIFFYIQPSSVIPIYTLVKLNNSKFVFSTIFHISCVTIVLFCVISFVCHFKHYKV